MFCQETSAIVGQASGDRNNCLYGSVAQSYGALHPSLCSHPEVLNLLDSQWRSPIHERLLPLLAPRKFRPPQHRWDANWNCDRAQECFNNRLFSGEAHIHVLACALGRVILVLQQAGPGTEQPSASFGRLAVMCYRPGLLPVRELNRAEVFEVDTPLVVFLSGRHFVPVLSEEQVMLPVFTPALALPGGSPLPLWSIARHHEYGIHVQRRAWSVLLLGEQLSRCHVPGAEYEFMEIWRDIVLPMLLPFF